jgi:hypothetical protein
MERAEEDIAAMTQENVAEFIEVDLAPFQERMQPLHEQLVDDGLTSCEVYDAALRLAGE